jgi:hypothetical protein
MIVGIVLSVPATPAPPSEPGGVITASENLLGSVGGDLKTRRSSNRVPCLAAVQRWTTGPAAVAATVVSVTG